MLPVFAPVKAGPNKAVPGAEQLLKSNKQEINKIFFNILMLNS